MVQNASHVYGRERRRLSVHCFCWRISVSQVCAFENSTTSRSALSRPMGRMFRHRWALFASVRGGVVAWSFYCVGARARRPNAMGCRGRRDGNNSARVVIGNAVLRLPKSSRYSKCDRDKTVLGPLHMDGFAVCVLVGSGERV